MSSSLHVYLSVVAYMTYMSLCLYVVYIQKNSKLLDCENRDKEEAGIDICFCDINISDFYTSSTFCDIAMT